LRKKTRADAAGFTRRVKVGKVSHINLAGWKKIIQKETHRKNIS